VVVTPEAPEASPTSPTLEGETTFEAILLKQRRRLADGTAAPTHLYPAFLVPKSDISSREAATGLCWRPLNMAQISAATNLAGNGAGGGGQHRLWSQLSIVVVVIIKAQRSNP
jgi:hypothetical protein